MDPLSNLSSIVNRVNEINTTIRPGMIDVSHATTALGQTNSTVYELPPMTPVSVPPAPPSTPTKPTFMSPPRTRIVTYRIPTSESSISFSLVTTIPTRGIRMTQINETDETSE